jgi:hypothetical protein
MSPAASHAPVAARVLWRDFADPRVLEDVIGEPHPRS